jgi:hypothetical protein
MVLPASGAAIAHPDCAPVGRRPDERLLVLALDGVPLRVVEAARAEGAFAGWGEPVSLVSTFPSMTNVAFTAMLEGFGVETIDGYELRHYDGATNRLLGGDGAGGYPWKKLFGVIGDSFAAKTALYTSPGRRARKVVSLVESALLASATPPVVLAHLAPTDMLAHLRGDGAMLEVVLDVAAALERIVPEHRERFGVELEVVLLSDHGNTAGKVAYTDGLRDALRAAGFRFGKRLDRPRSVVAPTYGAVSYGALYLDPALAEEAASAAVGHPSVDLAAWLDGDGRLRVLAPRGRAAVRWSETPAGRAFSYEVDSGDPLRLLRTRASLAGLGELDERGFATEQAWRRAGTGDWYPSALPRLVDSLDRRYVDNPATVILSLGPSYAWGLASVRLGASVMGGRLEGTHGGLDRESSLGFLMARDGTRQPLGPVAAERALDPWLEPGPCH